MKTSIRESKYSEMCGDNLSYQSYIMFDSRSYTQQNNKKEGTCCKSNIPLESCIKKLHERPCGLLHVSGSRCRSLVLILFKCSRKAGRSKVEYNNSTGN